MFCYSSRLPVAAIMIMTAKMRGTMIPRKSPSAIQRMGASFEGGLRGGGPVGFSGSPGAFNSTPCGGLESPEP